MAVLVEMIVDRGVSGSKLLQGLDVPEPGHRAGAVSLMRTGLQRA